MKLKKTVIITSLVYLLALIAMPVINYFYGSKLIASTINAEYLVHLITVASDITFDQIKNLVLGLVLSRDGLILITSAWFQLLFIITTLILMKRQKGLINYLLTLIFAVLSLSGVLGMIILYQKYDISYTFFTNQTYILLVFAVFNFAIYLVFSFFYIKGKIEEIFPITELTFLNAIYHVIKLCAVTVILLSAIVVINGLLLYSAINIVIVKISFESILGLPSILRIDLFGAIDSIPKNLEVILRAISFDGKLVEILNGELLIYFSKLSTSVQDFISSYVDRYYNTFITITSKFILLLVALQSLNYIHKKLEFKNLVVMLLLVATAITSFIAIPDFQASIYNFLTNFITITTLLYLLLFIDYKINDYKYTRKVCDFINNFKLSESFKSLFAAIGSESKNLAAKAKQGSKDLKDKVKDKKNKKK